MNHFLNQSKFLFFSFFVLITIGLVSAVNDSPGSNQNFWEKTTVTGKINKIDQKSHVVTLKEQNGNEISFAVDKKIDLSNFKNGDSVSAQYFRAVILSISKPTAAQEKQGNMVIERKTFSPAGIDIGGESLKQVKALTTIKSIDSANNTMIITGPDNKDLKILVPNTEIIKNFTAGEKAIVEYTESLATSLEKLK
jgi:Cu/Ag efflux protein CusF